MGQNTVIVQQSLARRPDWEAALDAYLLTARNVPFTLGAHDCCLFVCNAVLAMTGTDLAAPFRSVYATRRQAVRALKRYAGATTVEAIARRVTRDHGMAEIAPSLAGRGDVVLFENSEDYALALVGVDGSLLAASDLGHARVPRALARQAWRV